ncbi:MAG: T9SS type A sorting domain-containing protein [candidate division WOR-3 bacterium]|nr:T9SS type A sorting domain-containing protein [candidate division WOR-3 bacterium]
MLSISINRLYAHGVATHIAVGRATYSVWYNYDRAFYDSLTKTPANAREVVNKMLYPPKPNPLRTNTAIRFSLTAPSKVDLKVFNASGRLVKTLVNEFIRPGVYNLIWNGKDDEERTVSNGIYFIQLKTKEYDATQKMVLVR